MLLSTRHSRALPALLRCKTAQVRARGLSNGTVKTTLTAYRKPRVIPSDDIGRGPEEKELHPVGYPRAPPEAKSVELSRDTR